MPVPKASPSFITKALILAMLPLLPTAALADWSGNYAGLSLGQVTTGEIGAEFEGDAFDLSVESDAIFSGFYGVVGVSRGSATLASGVDLSADGINIGIGADYMVSDQFMIGAEFLARRMNEDDFAVAGINVDTTADTLAIRAAYKF